jgi:hypothetical protein
MVILNLTLGYLWTVFFYINFRDMEYQVKIKINLGKITGIIHDLKKGGKIKSKEDSESIKAEWISLGNLKEKIKNDELRGTDIIDLIEKYKKTVPLPLNKE